MANRRLWLITDHSAAAAIGQSPAPADCWPSLDINGVGYGDLARLWGVLRDQDEEEFREMMGKELYCARRPGAVTIVSAVPEPFLLALAEIAPDRLKLIAERWSLLVADDDVGPMGGRAGVAGWVRRLSECARLAQENGKPVLELLDA